MGRLFFQRLEFKPESEWIIGDTHALRFSATGDLEFWDVQQRRLIWHAATRGQKAVMQGDGNLVVYGKDDVPLWSSNTFGHPNAVLVADNEGYLAIVPEDDLTHILWRSEPEVRVVPEQKSEDVAFHAAVAT